MQAITDQEVKDWLSNPVTVAHRKRLEHEARKFKSPEGMGMKIGDTLEDLGLKAACSLNYIAGIQEAYDHDADLFCDWLKEAYGE